MRNAAISVATTATKSDAALTGNDQKLVLAAVQQNGGALYHTLGGLCDNKKVVMGAVRHRG